MNNYPSSYQLIITAHQGPALLERILRVIRHRGFTIHQMVMSLNETKKNITLDVIVNSQKPIYLLTNQLNKIINIQEVNILPLAVETYSYSRSFVN